MRILIVDTCYPAFLAHHYASTPGLERRSYAEQRRALMDTFFGTADSYSHFLGELGHEAEEIVVDCEPLQQAWAKEHGMRSWWRRRRRDRPSPEAIVAAQVEAFQPDVLYLQHLNALDADLLRSLGRGRLLAGQIASDMPPERQVRAFDLILTSFPHYVPRFRELGIPSEYLELAFDPRVLERLGPLSPRYGAVFVGNLGRRQHARGNDLLERAAERVPIEFWGYLLGDRPPESPFVRRYHGEAWGLDMYRVLGESRIAVNRHIDVAEDNANNMRLYEATGVGTLLLTDAKRNLGDLFEVGKEVVAYRDEDELVEAIEHYLAHEDERAAIAAAGQRRTLEQHDFAPRMRELAEILDSHLR